MIEARVSIRNVVSEDLGNMVVNQLEKFSDVPSNYHPVIRIECMHSISTKEEKEEVSKQISASLKMWRYPPNINGFWKIGDCLSKDEQEPLVSFCNFLNFMIADSVCWTTCSKFFCSEKRYKELYINCMDILSEIAICALRCPLKKRKRKMNNTEILIEFFRYNFLDEKFGNMFCTTKNTAVTRKQLITEAIQCFLTSLKSPKLLPKAYTLCKNLSKEVKKIFFSKDGKRTESRKKAASKGGSKRWSKFDNAVSDEWKEAIYQEFVNRFPDIVTDYKSRKKGSIQRLNRYIQKKLKNNNLVSKISESTTTKWASTLLKKHCND